MACRSMPASPLTYGVVGGAFTSTRTPFAGASAWITRADLVEERRRIDRLQAEVLRAA